MPTLTLDTELQLHYNGKEESVKVDKTALAGISSYFRNMFLGEWSERADEGEENKNKQYIIKEDVDFDVHAFKLMLKMNTAMATTDSVVEGSLEAETALTILKLSVKYDVPMPQDYCRKYLMNCSDYTVMELLEVADQFGIQQLKDHCLATLTTAYVLKNWCRNAEIVSRLSKCTRELLQERTDELVKKRANMWRQLADLFERRAKPYTAADPDIP